MKMIVVIALFLAVIAGGGVVGASADQPPDLSAMTCGTTAVQQAQAAGMKLPTDMGTGAMVCWYPAKSR